MNQIENEILKHLNKENKIIFDVGCFRGNFTTNIIKHENEKSKNTTFFLFDPNPNVKNYLNEMLKNKNVKYFCLAFDNTDSKKKFYLNTFFEPSGSSLNTIHKDDRKWTNTRKCFMQLFHPFKKLKEFEEIMVETKSIDVFCRENHINHIDLLKLDTEGNEFNVLNGAKTILSENKINVIYTEIIETKQDYNKKNDIFVNYLNKHGFKLKVSLPIRSFSFMSNLKGTDNLFINENFKN